MQRFHDALFLRLGLVVQPSKCECWIDEAHIASLDAHRGLVTRSHLLDGALTPHYGVMCYGVPIGSEENIKLALAGKCDEIASISNKLIATLSSSHKQQLWLLTLFSTARKFEYFARHCYPDQARDACTRFDAIIHTQATHALGVSLDDDQLATACLAFPRRYRGAGPRRMVDIAPAAFCGAMTQAVPNFLNIVDEPTGTITQRGMLELPQVALVVGRCRKPLPPQRQGQAFLRCWLEMQQEAGVGAGAMINADLPTRVLHLPQEEAWPMVRRDLTGKPSLNVQKDLTEDREAQRFDALKMRINALPRGDRVWVEITARFFSVPSPICVALAARGARLFNRDIDVHGDNIVAATGQSVTGDHISKLRHDPLLALLAEVARRMGAHARTEAGDIFASVLASNQVAYRLFFGGVGRRPGPKVDLYAEYDHKGGRARMAELIKIDRDFFHTTPGQTGPMQARAQTFCTAGGPAFAALVIGAFGEWSDDLEFFVGDLASMGARHAKVIIARARLERTGTGTGNGGVTRTDSDDDGNPDEWAEGAAFNKLGGLGLGGLVASVQGTGEQAVGAPAAHGAASTPSSQMGNRLKLLTQDAGRSVFSTGLKLDGVLNGFMVGDEEKLARERMARQKAKQKAAAAAGGGPATPSAAPSTSMATPLPVPVGNLLEDGGGQTPAQGGWEKDGGWSDMSPGGSAGGAVPSAGGSSEDKEIIASLRAEVLRLRASGGGQTPAQGGWEKDGGWSDMSPGGSAGGAVPSAGGSSEDKEIIASLRAEVLRLRASEAQLGQRVQAAERRAADAGARGTELESRARSVEERLAAAERAAAAEVETRAATELHVGRQLEAAERRAAEATQAAALAKKAAAAAASNTDAGASAAVRVTEVEAQAERSAADAESARLRLDEVSDGAWKLLSALQRALNPDGKPLARTADAAGLLRLLPAAERRAVESIAQGRAAKQGLAAELAKAAETPALAREAASLERALCALALSLELERVDAAEAREQLQAECARQREAADGAKAAADGARREMRAQADTQQAHLEAQAAATCAAAQAAAVEAAAAAAVEAAGAARDEAVAQAEAAVAGTREAGLELEALRAEVKVANEASEANEAGCAKALGEAEARAREAATATSVHAAQAVEAAEAAEAVRAGQEEKHAEQNRHAKQMLADARADGAESRAALSASLAALRDADGSLRDAERELAAEVQRADAAGAQAAAVASQLAGAAGSEDRDGAGGATLGRCAAAELEAAASAATARRCSEEAAEARAEADSANRRADAARAAADAVRANARAAREEAAEATAAAGAREDDGAREVAAAAARAAAAEEAAAAACERAERVEE
ncbi:hypothetical protein T492DRAFT_888355, partial [Pavlovales sp. CCMP2436]